ncbi:MAG: LicD family protein [Chlamydiae bacterium]|nr:LicD family protein [Chlamydiota bacterium]
MNFSDHWESFTLWVMHAGMPLVQCYHLLCGSPFLNVASEDASGIEKAANTVLTPFQYLFAGSSAVNFDIQENQQSSDVYLIKQRFNYQDPLMWHKTALSYIALPASLTFGTVLKGISYLSQDTRDRHHKIVASQQALRVNLQNEYYHSVGITPVDLSTAEKIEPKYHQRRPGEENILQLEKEALRKVVGALSENNIMFWVDCGTCLGTYRYGGIIPWDWDIDLAILQNDFDNVKSVLTDALDPNLYAVQDWSSRDKPKTYLKVYVKATGTLIDIYHFAIDEKNQTIYSILSNGDCVFLPESWKIRERRFTIPTSFDIVFPLKKASFDGIDVFVPAKTKEYLQQRYGENIEPAKVYNALSGQYEKDLSHPYWQRAHAQ